VWTTIITVKTKLKDNSSQTMMYAKQVIISHKRCQTDRTLQTTNMK